MKNGLFKIVCVTTALALVVAFGSPQLGKRKGTSGGGSTTTTGGTTSGSSGGRTTGGGGTTGERRDPPRRNETSGGGSGGSVTTGGSSGGTQTTGGGGGLGRRNDTGGGQSGGGETIDRGSGTGGNGRIIISGGGQVGRRQTNDSRSGQVRYGTVNNGSGRIQSSGIRIDRPTRIVNPGMQRRVLDRGTVSLVNNGWRNGYYHYDRRYQDDWFSYPHYVFNPWQQDRYVCSPWYYYPSLPPYLNSTRIIIINAGFPSYNWSGSSYQWARRNDNWNDRGDRREIDRDRDRGELDYALDDLQDAWERTDFRAIGRLVPRRGNVNMYFDGQYSYSLESNDFYDLFADGIENVRTTRYEITEVQRGRNGSARIEARHEFTDPWNRRNVTYHQYFLEEDGRNYVIREFGTSNQR